MKRTSYIALAVILLFAFPVFIYAQSNTYILNGTATQNKCNCYTLTAGEEYQNGSVWNKDKIDLRNSFDFVFNVNLGCQDNNGADGLAFILQPLSTSIGTYGEGMGFGGLTPSIGIPLDTYQNPNQEDPWYDNICIQANGQVTHGHELAGPVPASDTSNNIEDCKWHLLRITWNAVTNKISAYFDNVLRVEAHIDLVNSIFNNDPFVYWGFSAATGRDFNIQQFCTLLNPQFTAEFKDTTACIGNPVTFANQTQSFAPITNYFWDFGDGAVSNAPNPPTHAYMTPGNKEVKFAVTALDGCKSDTVSKIVKVGDTPVPLFRVFDTCARLSPRITEGSTINIDAVKKWKWILDGRMVSESRLPMIPNIPAGGHQLTLFVESTLGCISPGLTKTFTLETIPAADIIADDNCINKPVILKGQQTDNLTTIRSWNWYFPDGQKDVSQIVTHTFSSAGTKNIILTVESDKGCLSEPIRKNILINSVKAFAGKDTTILKDAYFQLNGSFTQTGNKPVEIKWSPDQGLEHNNLLSTRGTTEDTRLYTLSVITAEGCIAGDDIQVIVFKGSAVYVPTAFTPNHDGKNDLLRPYLIGIKQLYNFSIYDRWGELVYTTPECGDGWDGTLRGVLQPTGTYVWTLKAEDMMGNIYARKGTATLIR